MRFLWMSPDAVPAAIVADNIARNAGWRRVGQDCWETPDGESVKRIRDIDDLGGHPRGGVIYYSPLWQLDRSFAREAKEMGYSFVEI